MLKIAFRIDINPEIGTGHLSRMSVLAEAFTELSCECTFYKGEDEPVDYSGFDVIVVDTYQVDDAYITSLNAPSRIVVCYDDNALYTYDCDAVLNANLHAGELRFKFGAKTPRMLLGGKYALLRKEFRDMPTITIKKTATRVFVCFGGSDIRNMTPYAVKTLREIKDIRLTVVLGSLTSCDSDVFALAGDSVAVHKTPEMISRLMSECDIAVSSAGSMVYELAALGIPTITIVQADNQILIADYLSRNSLMRCVGDWENTNLDELRREVESLLINNERRELESYRLRRIVDRNGALNAARAILGFYRNK
jgi:spore coat polysaccharide biosynthesis predicted glycosyltransferase SpsG